MKKLIVLILGCMFALATWGQAKFTVPAPTDLQKYNTAAWQWNGAYVILISYARSLGQTVEEAATTVGDMAAATWDSSMTFDDLINSMLYTYVVMAPSGKAEILEQSAEKVVFSVTDFYKPLDTMLAEYKITRAELTKFYEIYAKQIADIIGVKYAVRETANVITVTISRN